MYWLLGILVSNISIALLEWIYRTNRFNSFFHALPYIIVPIIVGQLGLFYAFRSGGAKTLIYAGIVFTTLNILFRVVNTLAFIKEPVPVYTWLALVLMVAATFVGAIK